MRYRSATESTESAAAATVARFPTSRAPNRLFLRHLLLLSSFFLFLSRGARALLFLSVSRGHHVSCCSLPILGSLPPRDVERARWWFCRREVAKRRKKEKKERERGEKKRGKAWKSKGGERKKENGTSQKEKGKKQVTDRGKTVKEKKEKSKEEETDSGREREVREYRRKERRSIKVRRVAERETERYIYIERERKRERERERSARHRHRPTATGLPRSLASSSSFHGSSPVHTSEADRLEREVTLSERGHAARTDRHAGYVRIQENYGWLLVLSCRSVI